MTRMGFHAGGGGMVAHHLTHINDASDEIAGALDLGAIPDTLTGKDIATLDGYAATDFFILLTVLLFQAEAATGDATDPENTNDNNTATATHWDNVNEYVEIDFGVLLKLTQYRHYGDPGQNGDGVFKIQHWNGDAWIDNTVGIPTRTGSWCTWTPLTTPIVASKVRIVCTTKDSAGDSYDREWEMKY